MEDPSDMNIKVVVDGNIAGWARFGLIGLGVAMVYCGLALHSLPKIIAISSSRWPSLIRQCLLLERMSAIGYRCAMRSMRAATANTNGAVKNESMRASNCHSKQLINT